MGTVSWDSSVLDVQGAVLHSSSLLIRSLRVPYGHWGRSAPALFVESLSRTLPHTERAVTLPASWSFLFALLALCWLWQFPVSFETIQLANPIGNNSLFS